MNELDRTIMNLREVARDSYDEGAQDVAVDAVAVLIDTKAEIQSLLTQLSAKTTRIAEQNNKLRALDKGSNT